MDAPQPPARDSSQTSLLLTSAASPKRQRPPLPDGVTEQSSIAALLHNFAAASHSGSGASPSSSGADEREARAAAMAAARGTGLTVADWRSHPVTDLPPGVIMHIDAALGMSSDVRLFGTMRSRVFESGGFSVAKADEWSKSHGKTNGHSSGFGDRSSGSGVVRPSRPPILSRAESTMGDPIGVTSADTTVFAWGWLVVLGAFVNQLWCWGSFYALTVMLPTIQRDMRTSLEGVTWAMSMAAAVMFAWQLIVGWAAARYGPRVMATIGAFIYSTGMVCVASCRVKWELYICLGVVTGTGMALLGGSVQARVVGQYFDKRVGLALGIMVCGVSVGATFLPYVYTALMQTIGWRATIRCAAGVSLVTNLAAGSTFRPRQLTKRPLVQLEQGICKLLPVLLGLPLVMFGYWVVFIFVAPYALHAGLNSTEVATLVAVMSATNGLGRIMWGWVSDFLGALPVFTFNVVGKGVLVAAMPLVPTDGNNGDAFVPLLVYVGVIGLAAGGLFGMLPKILLRRFGVADFPSAYGLSTLCASIGSLTGSPLAAFLVEKHSWFEGLLVSGVVMVVGAIAMAALLVYVGRQHYPANLSREVSQLSQRLVARGASTSSMASGRGRPGRHSTRSSLAHKPPAGSTRSSDGYGSRQVRQVSSSRPRPPGSGRTSSSRAAATSSGEIRATKGRPSAGIAGASAASALLSAAHAAAAPRATAATSASHAGAAARASYGAAD